MIVEDADAFVTKERTRLEQYVASPSTTGVLVLDVQTWPSNTRLYKLLSDEGNISCKAPPIAKLPEWCVQWCSASHGKQLVVTAARLLVDLVGAEMGLLDQELAKLAAYVGDAKRIDVADVDALVGANRTQSTWTIFDLIGDGKLDEALTLLDRLFAQGEDPFRLLGAFSMQLRRLAQAGRLTAQARRWRRRWKKSACRRSAAERRRNRCAASAAAVSASCTTGCCKPTWASRASARCRRARYLSGL